MKVLLVDKTALDPVQGGMARAIETLAAGLVQADHEVIRFVPGPWDLRKVSSGSWPWGAEYRLGVPLPFAGGNRLKSWADWTLRTPSVILQIRSLLKREGVDIVHCTFHSVNFIFPILRRVFGVPYIVTLHGSDAVYFRKIPAGHRRFAASVVRGANAVVAVSGNVAAAAKRLVRPGQEVHVVHNGINVERVRLTAPGAGTLKVPVPYIVAVGTLSHVKGLDLLIAAWQRVKETVPEGGWKLVIVGEGPDGESLRSLSRRLGVSDSVVWAGWLPWEETLQVVAGAEVFVMPSRSEGLPYALLEAGALGVPVVASSVGAMPEVVRHEEGGIIVEPEKVEPLAKGLVRLLRNSSERQGFGAFLSRRIETGFSVKSMGGSHIDIYEDVLQSSRV